MMRYNFGFKPFGSDLKMAVKKVVESWIFSELHVSPTGEAT
jgi:hypothetical protein